MTSSELSREIEKCNKAQDYTDNVVRGIDIKLNNLTKSYDNFIVKSSQDRVDIDKALREISILSEMLKNFSEDLKALSTRISNLQIEVTEISSKTKKFKEENEGFKNIISKEIVNLTERESSKMHEALNLRFNNLTPKSPQKSYDEEIASLRKEMMAMVSTVQSSLEKTSDNKRFQDLEKNIALLFTLLKQTEDRSK